MQPLVVANWKMHPETLAEARRLFEATKKTATTARGIAIVVAPPATFLQPLSASYKGSSLSFAIQHARGETSGAFTGEISMIQAKNAGATYAIIGHAERRAAGETNEDTKTQVAAALSLGMNPILCVGERTRDAHGSHFAFIAEQVNAGLLDVGKFNFKNIVIAYEPVWAIGSTEPMRPHGIHETTLYIRKIVSEKFGTKAALAMPILYGGSVDEANARAVLREGTTQGLLVGRASVDALSFAKLLIALKGL